MNDYDFVIDLTGTLPSPVEPEPGKEPKIKTISTADESPSAEEAREFVGGYFELVHLRNGDQLLVNENGRLNELPRNKEASDLYGGVIVGDALHLKGAAKWT